MELDLSDRPSSPSEQPSLSELARDCPLLRSRVRHISEPQSLSPEVLRCAPGTAPRALQGGGDVLQSLPSGRVHPLAGNLGAAVR